MTTTRTTPTAIPSRVTGPETADVVVVGGGIAGLVAAVAAAEAPSRPRVVLLDAHAPGGRARVDEVAGFRFNRGPRALYRGGPLEGFLVGHGISVHGGPPPTGGGRALDGGVLHRMPGSPVDAARTTLFSLREKAAVGRAFARLPRLDPTMAAGRPAAELPDLLGLRGAPAAFLLALVRLATYIEAPGELDGAAALAQLQAATSSGVRYLDGGWSTILDGLEHTARALGVAIRPGTRVQAVGAPDPAGRRSVTTAAGTVDAAAVVLAGLSPAAATALVADAPPSWGAVGPPVTAACLELGLRTAPPVRFVLGVDEPVYLSVHCPPADLAPPGGAVVHLMRYHAVGGATSSEDDRAALHALMARAGITPDLVVEERFLASMTVAHAIPRADTGGRSGRPSIAPPEAPGLFLGGDWVGPEGLLADAAAASGLAAGAHAAARCATMARR